MENKNHLISSSTLHTSHIPLLVPWLVFVMVSVEAPYVCLMYLFSSLIHPLIPMVFVFVLFPPQRFIHPSEHPVLSIPFIGMIIIVAVVWCWLSELASQRARYGRNLSPFDAQYTQNGPLVQPKRHQGNLNCLFFFFLEHCRFMQILIWYYFRFCDEKKNCFSGN